MPTPGRLKFTCIPVRNLISIAYGALTEDGRVSSRMIEVTGGPGWLDNERYTISAKAESNAPVAEMVRTMLPALLEERFQLKVHREAKETNVYALTVAKSGPKLQPMKEGSCTPIDINNLPKRPAPGESEPRLCGGGGMRSSPSGGVMDSVGISMPELAGRMLQGRVDRPVVDKTGLNGRYDVHLEFTPENFSAGPVRLNGAEVPAPSEPAVSAGPSIFTALQQQLGLKLTPEKGSVEILVVDHVEKPSDN